MSESEVVDIDRAGAACNGRGSVADADWAGQEKTKGECGVEVDVNDQSSRIDSNGLGSAARARSGSVATSP